MTKKLFLKVFIGMFIVISTIFLIKWVSHGEDYIFHFKEELELFANIISPLYEEVINSFQSIAVSNSFLNGILNILKTIGLAVILPFRVIGGILKWLLF